MESFSLHVLGCGSALPTQEHWPTSQAIELRGKIYLIDCGEGCQLMLRRQHISFSKVVAIFISHLHGDHLFGLPGLLSTLALLGRKGTLYVYGPKGISEYIRFVQKHFLDRSDDYPIEVFEHGNTTSELIFEDNSLYVRTIPLNHRIPTTGYLFEEKCAARHLNRSAVDFFGIPIVAYRDILDGFPFVLPDGQIIDNKKLTFPGREPRRYAFCSDTCYKPNIVSLVKDVTLLYHEATYCEADAHKAEAHFHSTAKQAAMIAQSASVKRLLLGHFSSRYNDLDMLLNEAKEVFPNTLLANEGLIINL